MLDLIGGSSLDLEVAPLVMGLFADSAHGALSPKASARTRRRRDTLGGESRDSTLATTAIDRLPPYDVLGDESDLAAWVSRSRIAAMLDVAARELSRAFGSNRPRARLVVDVDYPDDKIVLLVVPTQHDPDAAVDALVRFTGTEWWMRMVTATQGGIVVDVECA